MELTNVEIIYDMPESDYHAMDRFSSSWAKGETPAHSEANKNKPPTPAMKLGSAVHSLVLGGPEVVLDFDPPSYDWRKKKTTIPEAVEYLQYLGLSVEEKDIKTKADFEAGFQAHKDSLGGIILGEEDYEKAHFMAAKVKTSGLIPSFESQNEVTVLGILEGVPIKLRIDSAFMLTTLLDLKSCYSVAEHAFQKASVNFGYWIQAGFYSDVWRMANGLAGLPEFIFVAIENKPPHEVRAFTCSKSFIDAGINHYRHKLLEYQRCMISGEFHGYPEEPVELDLPYWKKKELGLLEYGGAA